MNLSLKAMACLVVLLAVDFVLLLRAEQAGLFDTLLFLAVPLLNVLLVVAVDRRIRSIPFLIAGLVMIGVYLGLCLSSMEAFAKFLERWLIINPGFNRLHDFLLDLVSPLGMVEHRAKVYTAYLVWPLVAFVASSVLLTPALLVGWFFRRRPEAGSTDGRS